MFLLPESIKKIGSKTNKKRWKHHFPHHKTMGVFLDILESANYSILCGTIWSKFELLLNIMHFFDTYTFKMDWINTKREKWKHQFFRRLRAASSVVSGQIWPNFKLIQALMYVIITCKYEKDPIKNSREKVATQLFKL